MLESVSLGNLTLDAANLNGRGMRAIAKMKDLRRLGIFADDANSLPTEENRAHLHQLLPKAKIRIKTYAQIAE